MVKRILATSLILFLLLSSVVSLSMGFEVKLPDIIEQSPDRGNILYVGGSGPDNYTAIQVAIDDANDGDTVFVFDDSSPYFERLLINKSINLIGENRDSTIIDGDYQGDVVVIQSDNVTVNGFKIINCVVENQTKCVIHVHDSKNAVIKDNDISVGKNFMIYGIYGIGIFIENSSYSIIHNNTIFKKGLECVTKGLMILYNSNNNNVSENEIYGYSSAIDTEDSNDNVFYANNVHHNEYGILMTGNNNCDIINNKINNNSHIGIRLNLCMNSLVYNNKIIHNGPGKGLWISRCSSVRIMNNNISNNKKIGIFIDYPKAPRIGHIVSGNNFIDNEKNAFFYILFLPIFIIFWNENYWSDNNIQEFPLKIIHGEVHINTYTTTYTFKMINFDWHPASEPYDI